MSNSLLKTANTQAGLFTLAFRMVIGWTYFSAFWRRLILENKLIPEEAGYIGEKFNHFLPNALFIKPIIEHLVTNPDQLQISMVVFTIIEAIVGLFLIFGFFTRFMSIGVFGLAMGILLGSGWIGTTCLDEWQIGVLGVAGGFTLFFTGSGPYSIDYLLMQKQKPITKTKLFQWFGSGELPFKNEKIPVLVGSLFILGLTLFTNQVFHGGVYGTLHNKSVKPKVEISNATLYQDELKFQIYRVEGADVYGSFLIGIDLLDSNGKSVLSLDGKQLSKLDNNQINNYYVTKVKPGKHSLIIPLGGKANLQLPTKDLVLNQGEKYLLKLTDISGTEWTETIQL